MLHALVAHLPTGIFFVQGAKGQPVLVNARARQLLGQREDPAAGVSQLPKAYRLFKPNGQPYQATGSPEWEAAARPAPYDEQDEQADADLGAAEAQHEQQPSDQH
jgi:hypothetical protein